MSQNQFLYQLSGIKFRYPGSRFKLEIDQIKFEPGKIVALVGPNGAGKTSLLLLLALLQKPEQGTLEFLGENPWLARERILEKRREIVMVTHHPYLFKGTVWENLVFGLRLRGIPESEWQSRTEEILSMVELKDLLQKRTKELSAGQVQRVALARAMIVKPRVLLLDEPTANLDPETTNRTEALIRELNLRLGTTIIFTTHNFSQAFRLAQEVIYLSEGKQVEYSHENYFSGKAETDGKISWLEPKPGIKIFFPGDYSGHLTCLISPEKIEVLPVTERIEIMGPNQFLGKITRLELTETNRALIRVSGELNFRLNLPVKELEIRKISLSSQVLIKFEPSEVKVINSFKERD